MPERRRIKFSYEITKQYSFGAVGTLQHLIAMYSDPNVDSRVIKEKIVTYAGKTVRRARGIYERELNTARSVRLKCRLKTQLALYRNVFNNKGDKIKRECINITEV